MKHKAIWVQAAIWIVLFLMPAMFADPGEELTVGRYLVKSTATLCILIAFYVTYLWLMPAYLKGKRTQFWAVNTLLVLALALGHHRLMTYLWHHDHRAQTELRQKHNDCKPKPEPKRPVISFDVLIIGREMFQYAVVIGVASSIVLSLRYVEAEKARREAESARTKAELDNLRSQVNPHFLLNTLNGIYALTAFDPQKAQSAIMELSKMMRHILYDNQQPYVNLEEEVQFINNYISLMRMRTGAHVRIDTQFLLPTPCSVTIAPMILISLVENAFKHGISPTEPSFIKVVVEADDNSIQCLVANSNYPKTSQDRSGHGIGLQQVARRLELSYAGRYQWQRGLQDDNTYSSKITIQL